MVMSLFGKVCMVVTLNRIMHTGRLPRYFGLRPGAAPDPRHRIVEITELRVTGRGACGSRRGGEYIMVGFVERV